MVFPLWFNGAIVAIVPDNNVIKTVFVQFKQVFIADFAIGLPAVIDSVLKQCFDITGEHFFVNFAFLFLGQCLTGGGGGIHKVDGTDPGYRFLGFQLLPVSLSIQWWLDIVSLFASA